VKRVKLRSLIGPHNFTRRPSPAHSSGAPKRARPAGYPPAAGVAGAGGGTSFDVMSRLIMKPLVPLNS
jgi:hypothetical protein